MLRILMARSFRMNKPGSRVFLGTNSLLREQILTEHQLCAM